MRDAIRFTLITRRYRTNGRTHANQKYKFFLHGTSISVIYLLHQGGKEINDPICCFRCRFDDNDYRLTEFRKSTISLRKVILHLRRIPSTYPPIFIFIINLSNLKFSLSFTFNYMYIM